MPVEADRRKGDGIIRGKSDNQHDVGERKKERTLNSVSTLLFSDERS